jgi:5'-phosphate synthase pdxT subunit
VKNKIFHTQDLCLRTNLRCAKNSARMENIMSEKVSIGILAVQGAFAEHQAMLDGLGADTFLIRQKKDLEEAVQNGGLQGIVLPGGESTVQGKLLRDLGMSDQLKELIEAGTPVLATCAGLILLAERVSNDDRAYLKTLPVSVKRNAYGRQLGSFVTDAEIAHIGTYRMNFIRAPYIDEILNPQVETLAIVDGNTVAVRYKNQLALSFHPEVSEDARVHAYFLNEIVQGV